MIGWDAGVPQGDATVLLITSAEGRHEAMLWVESMREVRERAAEL